MVPGMLMSLKTRSICVPLAKMATASAALAASMTRYPVPRRNSATALRIRISSSTTKTAGCRVASSCEPIAPQTPMIPEQTFRDCCSVPTEAIPFRPRRGPPSFKKNVDPAHHLLRMIRLFQGAFVAEIRGLLGRLGNSRGEDHIDAGLLLANPLREPNHVH